MKPATAILVVLSAAVLTAAESEFANVPAGVYRPFLRSEKDAVEVPVSAFRLGAQPVTNGEFLEFVRANPQWRRSQVKRLFADNGYLQHWAGDLDPGAANARQPVTFVSWFAAKAYCSWKGARLPTTAEWEFAASAGFTSADGANEPEFTKAVARWYSTPAPPALPPVGAGRANFHGIHDLHGLVWEWTSDFNSALVTGDARGDTGLDRQLFCGAGALGAKDIANYPAFMRFGFRSSLKASYAVHNLGFRVAADEKPSPCCLVVDSAKPPRPAMDTSLYQLSSTWTGDDGRQSKLESLRGRPQVLALIFASCEFSCPILVHQMQGIEKSLPAELNGEVGFTLVSIDPERDTPEALRAFRERMRLAPEHWTLLRGTADDVRELAALLGVNYRRDARGQFAHTSLITVLNSEGEIVHQQAGTGGEIGPVLSALERSFVEREQGGPISTPRE